MPWKTDSTKGHLAGVLLDSVSGTPLDGAIVLLSGASSRTLKADATGFFGSVDLPIGTYTLTINIPGYRPVTKTVTVNGGQVAEPGLVMERLPFIITNSVHNPVANTLTITWNSLPGKTYRIERSQDLTTWSSVTTGLASGGGGTIYIWQIPPAWTGQAFLRAVEEN
jgi:hypothetical protein